MSDAYAIVDIPKSLSIHGMALASTGRKIEHSKVVQLNGLKILSTSTHPPDYGLKTLMSGIKSIVVGLLMLLGVFMVFLYIYTMLISTNVAPA